MAKEQEATTNIVFRTKESEASTLQTMAVKGTPPNQASRINTALDRGERFISFETGAGKKMAIKVDRIESIADA